MNSEYDFIFKSVGEVILEGGGEMSFEESPVTCNLDLSDQHVFARDIP